MTALRKYLDEERGRAFKLSQALEVTPGAVTQWADKQVPAERIFKVSEMTGIPIQDLRPDLFDEVA